MCSQCWRSDGIQKDNWVSSWLYSVQWTNWESLWNHSLSFNRSLSLSLVSLSDLMVEYLIIGKFVEHETNLHWHVFHWCFWSGGSTVSLSIQIYPFAVSKVQFRWLRQLVHFTVHHSSKRIKVIHMFLDWCTTQYTSPRGCIPLAHSSWDTTPEMGYFVVHHAKNMCNGIVFASYNLECMDR